MAEICARQGFFPDTISTDVHLGSNRGPCYDMATAATKMLHVGQPLADVIRACTTVPAATIGWGDRIGSLKVGMAADVALLELADCEMELEDCQAQLRTVRQRLVGRAVWKGGKRFAVTTPEEDTSHRFGFPSQRSVAMGRMSWDTLCVRDATPPPPVAEEFQKMVDDQLQALRERAEEALMRSSVGDGNPNVPAALYSMPFCLDVKSPAVEDSEDDKGESAEAQAAPQLLALEDKPRVQTLELADAAAPAHAAGRRLLISFPESEAYLEKLRREALIIGCC